MLQCFLSRSHVTWTLHHPFTWGVYDAAHLASRFLRGNCSDTENRTICSCLNNNGYIHHHDHTKIILITDADSKVGYKTFGSVHHHYLSLSRTLGVQIGARGKDGTAQDHGSIGRNLEVIRQKTCETWIWEACLGDFHGSFLHVNVDQILKNRSVWGSSYGISHAEVVMFQGHTGLGICDLLIKLRAKTGDIGRGPLLAHFRPWDRQPGQDVPPASFAVFDTEIGASPNRKTKRQFGHCWRFVYSLDINNFNKNIFKNILCLLWCYICCDVFNGAPSPTVFAKTTAKPSPALKPPGSEKPGQVNHIRYQNILNGSKTWLRYAQILLKFINTAEHRRDLRSGPIWILLGFAFQAPGTHKHK